MVRALICSLSLSLSISLPLSLSVSMHFDVSPYVKLDAIPRIRFFMSLHVSCLKHVYNPVHLLCSFPLQVSEDRRHGSARYHNVSHSLSSTPLYRVLRGSIFIRSHVPRVSACVFHLRHSVC